MFRLANLDDRIQLFGLGHWRKEQYIPHQVNTWIMLKRNGVARVESPDPLVLGQRGMHEKKRYVAHHSLRTDHMHYSEVLYDNKFVCG